MKKGKLFWGFGFLLAAALIILDVIGVIPALFFAVGEVSAFSLILGLLLLAYALAKLCKGNIPATIFPLAFIFLLFEKNVAYLCAHEGEDLVNNWLVMLIALLLHIGFSILLPSHSIYKIKCTATHERSNALNSAAVYVDCESFTTPSIVANKLGECIVHFQNADRYQSGQTLSVSNSLGAMTINVPASWRVLVDVENHLGALEIPEPEYDDPEAPVLYVRGSNHLGALEIILV